MPPTSLTAEPREPVAPRHWLVLALLIALTSVVRLWGIDHSLPHSKEADAHIALHAERLREGLTDPDPRNNDNQYPIVLPWLQSRLPSSEAPLAERATLDDHLRAAGAVYREARVEIALLSLLLVPLAFALARRFTSNRWALFAAALVATSFLTHYFAQQARPHAAAASFFTLAVLASMRLARKPTLGAYVLAALACALSIGVLHSGLATLPALLVAALLAPLYVVHEPAARLYRRLAVAPLLVLAVVGASFAAFYPYLQRASADAQFDKPRIEQGMLIWGDHHVAFGDFVGRGFGVVLRTMWYYEPGLLVLLAVGLAVLAWRKLPIYRPYDGWSDKWVALAFALPYLVAIGLFERTFERFAIPLLPFAAAFIAWALEHLVAKLPRTRIAVLALAALALVPGVAGVLRLSSLRASPDSLELAARWLEAQPDAHDARVYVAPQFDLPLARNAESLQPTDGRPAGVFSRWSIYQKRLGVDAAPPPRWDLRYLVPRPDLGYPFPAMESDPEGYLRALGQGYFVIDVSRQPARSVFTDLPQLLRGVAGEPVARIGPNESWPAEDGPHAGWSLPFEDELVPGWPHVLARTLHARCVGPVVEIYRVP